MSLIDQSGQSWEAVLERDGERITKRESSNGAQLADRPATVPNRTPLAQTGLFRRAAHSPNQEILALSEGARLRPQISLLRVA